MEEEEVEVRVKEGHLYDPIHTFIIILSNP